MTPALGHRSRSGLSAAMAAAFLVLGPPARSAEADGRIEGRVTRPDGEGLEGVAVAVVEQDRATATDASGRYVLTRLPPGEYALLLTLGEHSTTETVRVEDAAPVTVETTVDWPLGFAESITVHAASRRPERIVGAPSAVSYIAGSEIERQASHGQLPRLLATAAGTQAPQSGLYDFSVNSRGFNSTLNSRTLVLIDGRDPSFPGVGSQEWSAVSFPLDELASAELVRGPASALYGAGAFSAVIDLTTKAPRDSVGGQLRVTAGELDSERLEGRHAGSLAEDWYYKATAGHHASGNFTRSRVDGVEYAPGQLPTEAVPLPLDGIDLAFGGLRLDGHLGSRLLTLEAGTADVEGPVFVSGLGRLQQTDVERPWARLGFSTQHWSFLASYTARDSRDSVLLSTGTASYVDTYRYKLELQGNTPFAGGRGHLVGGADAGSERADSADPRGVQTQLDEKQKADRSALFGQVDYEITDRLRGVFSLRWDDSELHEGKLSPRGALVYSFDPSHSLRFSYGVGFKSPSFAEFFLRAPVVPSLDLSAIEAALAPLLGGVPLGFSSIPFLALGNEALEVEEIRSFEIGYRGIPDRRLFLNVDYYRNELENFTTNLLSQVGTSFGRLNPSFGPYAPPPELSPAAAALVLATLGAVLPPELLAVMSNDPDGSPIFALFSFGSFGRADTEGLELSLSYAPTTAWRLDFSYSYFDFEIREEAPENPLVPNTPEHQLAAALTYLGDRFDASLSYRWVNGFDWASGAFVGPVPSYGVVDSSFNLRLSDRWRLGVDAANLLDDRHYEIFGGDLLDRRVLGHVTLSW